MRGDLDESVAYTLLGAARRDELRAARRAAAAENVVADARTRTAGASCAA
jgi:hypothetical protein